MEQRYTLLFDNATSRDVVGPIPPIGTQITFEVNGEDRFYAVVGVTNLLDGYSWRSSMATTRVTVHVVEQI